MKKVLLLIYVTCTVIFLNAQDVLHIMSLNMDAGRENTMDSIALFINKYNPDIVALQEVDMFSARSEERHANSNFLAELGSQTTMFSAFGKVMPINPYGSYGNAVLSKQPFLKTENVLLPMLDKTEQRGMMVTHLTFNNHRICFASVHLSYENEEIVETQLKYIKRYMDSLDDDCLIICGDYNLNHPNKVLAIMDEWQDALPKNENTFSSGKSFYRRMKLDYMLYKSILPIKVITKQIECNPSITDHCACYIELEIPSITIPQ